MKNILKQIKKFFTETPTTNYQNSNPVITYGEYYYEAICPKCEELLNEKKARYETRCCYKCGFVNDMLFSVKQRVVRKKYINGVFSEKIISNLEA